MDVMATIDWCKKQKNGIKIIDPSDNLADEYIGAAEESLDTLKAITKKSRVWQATTKYYCEYFACYALLMKLGIKSEIHECTIAVCKKLEKEKILPDGYAKILESDKQLRIDNQYYLRNKEVHIELTELTDFILQIKEIITKINDEDVERIRRLL